MAQLFRRFGQKASETREAFQALHAELAQRLLAMHSQSERKEWYLVSGVILGTNNAGKWDVASPDYEVDHGLESHSPGRIAMGLPSAFHLFVLLGDYKSAQRIVEDCPNAFCSPGLKGWSLAVQAFNKSDGMDKLFADASDAFAKDVPPPHEELMRRGFWSATNIDLWAPYFRARSIVARVPHDSNRMRGLISDAEAVLKGTETWSAPQVTRFRVLFKALRALIIDKAIPDVDSAKQELQTHCAFFGEEPQDGVLLHFLNMATEALEEFRRAPNLAVTSGRLHLFSACSDGAP